MLSSPPQGSPPTPPVRSRDWSWPFWPVLPLYPYGQRRTLLQEILPETLWTLDQIQGILYAVAPVRMTVVRLEEGGLLVYAPVAPTRECLGLLQDLIDRYGDVRYILHPTSSGLEHKVFVGPFARCFPQAQVWVAPHQWSYPVNLPLRWLGFPPGRTQVLPPDSSEVPFGREFDYAILDIDLRQGAFGEVALFHRRSRSLLLTDSLISIPAEPPPILELDPYPLLFHARDRATDPMIDSPEQRLKGWQRIALFAVYFRPAAVQPLGLGQIVKDALQAPGRSPRSYFGLYPFQWRENWPSSFLALRGNGRPFVAPILQTLILPQDPPQVIAWANRVARWNFERILPCHMEAPILAGPTVFRRAFSFLETSPHPSNPGFHSYQALPLEDFGLLKDLERTFIRWGIAMPPKPPLGSAPYPDESSLEAP